MRIILLVSLLLTIPPLFAGNDHLDEIKSDLKMITAKMNEVGYPKGNRTHYLKYQQNTVFKDKSVSPDLFINVELQRSRSQLYFKSNLYNVFMDDENVVLVSHPRKLVLLGPSTVEEVRSDAMEKIKLFRDTLLKHCKVLTYYNVKEGTKKLRHVILRPDPITAKVLRIAELEIVYDPNEIFFRKVIIHYGSKHVLDRTTYYYQQFDLNQRNKLTGSVVRKVLTASGKLQPQLRGYGIIDNRINEKR